MTLDPELLALIQVNCNFIQNFFSFKKINMTNDDYVTWDNETCNDFIHFVHFMIDQICLPHIHFAVWQTQSTHITPTPVYSTCTIPLIVHLWTEVSGVCTRCVLYKSYISTISFLNASELFSVENFPLNPDWLKFRHDVDSNYARRNTWMFQCLS